jgi:hypothetical protein
LETLEPSGSGVSSLLWLVVAVAVEGEYAEEFAGVDVRDADVKADVVVESSGVAEGDYAVCVDGVGAD